MSQTVGILEAVACRPFPPCRVIGAGSSGSSCPVVVGAVEASFSHRDLAGETRGSYRQALGPLVEGMGDDCGQRSRRCRA